MEDGKEVSFEMVITFPMEHHAAYIHKALVVDKELKSKQITKELRADGNNLIITLYSSEENAKFLRTSASSIFDMVHLACRTLNQFDV